MNFCFGTFLALFSCLIESVMSTMYCSSVTLHKVSAISCGNGYHCCKENTQCCLNAGYLPNGAIVGIAVGGALIIAIIVCLTVCYVKSRQKMIKPTNTEVDNETAPSAAPTTSEHAGYDQAIYDEVKVENPPPYSAPGEVPPKYTI